VNESYTLNLAFRGTIDDRVLFLRRAKIDHGEFSRDMPPTVNNATVLINRQFSYLFPETYWYPQLYNPYAFSYPEKRPENFFTGKWSVNVPEDLIALAQGESVSVDSTTHPGRKNYSYEADIPVDRISLNTGRYNTYSIDINDITLKLFVSRNHDEIITFFEDIREEVNTVFSDALRGITGITGLEYPFPTLTYVEVPIVIQWYQDAGIHRELTAQPGIVMVSEDILMKSYKERFDRKRRRADRRRIEKSDKDIKKEILIELIVDQMFSDNWWNQDKIATPISSYWSHRINFTGKVYPVYEYYFDKFLEELIAEEIEFYITNQEQEERLGDTMSPWEMRMVYKVEVDTLYNLLRTVPMADMMPSAESDNYHGVMMYKTGRLNNILRELVTPENFRHVLGEFLETYAYSDVMVEDYQAVSERVTRRNLVWFFDDWLTGNALPGYYITGVDTYKLKGGKNGVQYLVEARLKNGEPDDGYVKVMLRTKDDRVIKRSEIKARQELVFGFLVDDYPEEVIVNPIFARNVGNISSNVYVPDRFEKRQPWDDIREVSSGTEMSEAITVDDLDQGFKIITLEEQRYFRPPQGEADWRIRDSSLAFGKYKNTYRRKRPGDGSVLAQWQAEIPASGIYEVQTFIFKGRDWERRRLERRVASEFLYTIKHGEGTAETSISWVAVSEGWNDLGRFYFEQGNNAIVTLTDDANGELIADAVRFIPVRLSVSPDANH